MDNLKPLNKLNVNGDIAEKWRDWKQTCKLFVIATKEHEKDENIWCAIFLQI